LTDRRSRVTLARADSAGAEDDPSGECFPPFPFSNFDSYHLCIGPAAGWLCPPPQPTELVRQFSMRWPKSHWLFRICPTEPYTTQLAPIAELGREALQIHFKFTHHFSKVELVVKDTTNSTTLTIESDLPGTSG
jgi:hypothetical protein